MNLYNKLKALFLSYPDKNYLDWKISDLKRSFAVAYQAPVLSQNILFRSEPGVSDARCCDEELIVSLSTFGHRIHGVALTIETLMEQTVKPNRIILNLGKEFEGRGRIPGSLKLLERRGLEIRFTRDIGPYTKLLPTLRDFPDATIITVDDDILYDYDLVSNLVNEHINHPADVIASRCRIIETERGKVRLPFLLWDFARNGAGADMKFLPEGVRGILYPPKALDERVFDEETFMKLCPTTDDFWLKAMSMLKGTTVRKCYTENEQVNLKNEKSDLGQTLHEVNMAGGYDRQIQALFEHFGLCRLIDCGK